MKMKVVRNVMNKDLRQSVSRCQDIRYPENFYGHPKCQNVKMSRTQDVRKLLQTAKESFVNIIENLNPWRTNKSEFIFLQFVA